MLVPAIYAAILACIGAGIYVLVQLVKHFRVLRNK